MINAEWLQTMSGPLRLGLFLSVLLFCLVCERWFPRRPPVMTNRHRWLANYALLGWDVLAVRLVLPLGLVEVAIQSGQLQWGIGNQINLPTWLEIVLVCAVMDLLIYGQHVLFHKVPWLWKIHRVHHSDTAVDASTGVRFHPLEILLSVVLKGGAVIVLGASPLAILCYEILLNIAALFNHSNLALPVAVDRVLRCFVVTPDMHRIHHSINPQETESNYGNFLSCWDRLFHTWCRTPQQSHKNMPLGLDYARDMRSQQTLALLRMPFRNNGDRIARISTEP